MYVYIPCFRSGKVRRVRLGDIDLKDTADDVDVQMLNVVRWIPHPDYRESENYHDIGLLLLDRDVIFDSYVNPACLHNQYIVPEDEPIATGWGRTEPGLSLDTVSIHLRGPGSVISIATGYGLDGLGIESRWGREFPHLSRLALVPTQPSLPWVPGLSPGVKSGRGVTLTRHPFECRGHERVELYLYFPYGPYGLYKGALYLYLTYPSTRFFEGCHLTMLSFDEIILCR